MVETSSGRVSVLKFFNRALWSSNTTVLLSHLKYSIGPRAEKLQNNCLSNVTQHGQTLTFQLTCKE